MSYANSAFCRLLGKTRGELIGNPFADIVPGMNGCVPILDQVCQARDDANSAQADDCEPNPAFWLYAMWPALDENERPVGVVIQVTRAADFRQNVTAINEALLISGLRQHELTEAAERLNAQLQKEVTGRKQAEKRRKEYSRKLQVLSRRLVETQETERRHLALELQEGIGQDLTAVQLNLQTMLQTPVSAALEPRVTDGLAVLDRVLEQVRDISFNLRASLLDDLGLEPALQWYTRRQAGLTGLTCEVQADPLERRLDPVIETTCFRVAQEALTNVARHARARKVTVELRRGERQLHLRVRDDGVGFQVAAVRAKAMLGAGLGLLRMEECAVLAGGQLEFNSAPSQGAEVHAWFPLKWQTVAA